MQQGLEDLLTAAPDRQPELAVEDRVLRRHGRACTWCRSVTAVLAEARRGNRRTPDLGRGCAARPASTRGAGLRQAGDPLRSGLRQGGERLRPRADGPSRPLKKWLQEQGSTGLASPGTAFTLAG